MEGKENPKFEEGYVLFAIFLCSCKRRSSLQLDSTCFVNVLSLHSGSGAVGADTDVWHIAGAADGSLKVWDRRNTGKAAFSLDMHTSPLLRVEWANYPNNPGEVPCC